MIDWLKKNHFIHTWGKWEEWGITWEQRRCLVCGKAQRGQP